MVRALPSSNVWRRIAAVVVLAAIAGACACEDDRPPLAGRPDTGPPPVCEGAPAGVLCIADVTVTCDGAGGEVGRTDCAATGEICARGFGCRLCVPNTTSCDGETVQQCNSEGTAVMRGETCDAEAGLRCSPLGCRDLCADAVTNESYIGCEYWPVTTRNSELQPEFTFAVVVANPALVPAEVAIARGDTEVARAAVAPGGLETIELPWVEELRNPEGGLSTLVTAGAYRLASDVPVTVYQFNPLQYRRAGDCAMEPSGMASDGQCYSFTNDASLLLPTHVLTGSYIGVSRATHYLRVEDREATSPGFLTIVGVDDTPVTVEVRSRAYTAPSPDGAVMAMEPRDTQTFTLGAGDVLQLASSVPTEGCPTEWVRETGYDVAYCDLGPDWDLTGTEVRASGRVSLIGGHDCTFLPFNRWACDHLEETIFPVEALGTEVVVANTAPLRGEPNILRVVSAADDNLITLEPALAEPRTLDRGEHFEVVLDRPVRVRGRAPLLAAQYLVGQDYFGIGTSGRQASGDPALALAIPTEQFRSEYTFLAPTSYDRSHYVVIAPASAVITLDGVLIPALEVIEGTGMGHTSGRINGGVHQIEGTAPFGILVYGYGSYTSYVYPGGLDLRRISPPI